MTTQADLEELAAELEALAEDARSRGRRREPADDAAAPFSSFFMYAAELEQRANSLGYPSIADGIALAKKRPTWEDRADALEDVAGHTRNLAGELSADSPHGARALSGVGYRTNVEKAREAIAADPTITPQEAGQMIEDAIEADDLRALELEQPTSDELADDGPQTFTQMHARTDTAAGAERIRAAREARGMADPLNRLRARNAAKLAAGAEPVTEQRPLPDHIYDAAHELADAAINLGGYADDDAESDRRAAARDELEARLLETVRAAMEASNG